MRTWIIEIVGLHSEGCIDKITQALSSLPGMGDVTVSLLHSRVTVSCDERLPLSRIEATLEKAGYRACEWQEEDDAVSA